MFVMLFTRENRGLLIIPPLLCPLDNVLVTPASPLEPPSVCPSSRRVRYLQICICGTKERLANIIKTVLDVIEIRGGPKTRYERLRWFGWRGAVRRLQPIELRVVG